MQKTNINHLDMKISALDSVESRSHSIVKEGDSAYKGIVTDKNNDQLTPKQNLNLKKYPKLKVSKFNGRLPYSELVKVNLCVSIDYENCRIPSYKLFGNVETVRNELDLYDIPNINENQPIAISMQIDDEPNLPQYKIAITEITHILYYHLFERIRQQLPNIPNQLLTTEFSATVLCIHHDSLLELFEEGVLQNETFEKAKCVKSIDLFEYITKINASRESAFIELLQCEQ